MDSDTFAVLESTARHIFEEDLPLDPDECHMLGIDFDALSSLVNQMSVRALKAARGQDPLLIQAILSRISLSSSNTHLGKEHNVLSQSDESSKTEESNREYQGSYATEPSCSCASIAHRFRINGYKMARLVLEAKYGKNALTVQQLLTENPVLFEEDKVLHGELLRCMSYDRFNSHPCEQLKECVGHEYEEYLIERLTQQNMCFETEAELRSRGKPRTPDILFRVPMAVSRNSVHKISGNLLATDSVTLQTGIGAASMTRTLPVSSATAWDDSDPSDAYTSRLVADGATSASSPARGASHNHGTQSQAPHTSNISLKLLPPDSEPTPFAATAENLAVVNWIDSKALFADQETFAEHFEQLRGYINRYGRGLVIYWHGYHAQITQSDLFLSTNGMVLLADTFPREWISPSDKEAPTMSSTYADSPLSSL